MTNMLQSLELPTLQQRRKEDRLSFLFKISQGSVPAIPKEEYLIPITNKRTVRAKTFKDCVTTNIVDRHQNLNKNSYKLPETKGDNSYKNSFFPKTIAEWNQLEGISADTEESFRNQIKNIF